MRWVVAVVCYLAVVWSIVTIPPERQFRDDISTHGTNEIRAWVDDEPVAASGLFGPSRESSCGIFYFTHHPLLGSYIAVLYGKLGFDRWELTHRILLSGVSGTFLGTVALANPYTGIVATAGWLGAIFLAPGIHEWVDFPIEHTWAITACFLLACAGFTRRADIWVPLAVFVTAWLSIDLVGLHAAMVAGVLIARYGLTKKAITVGVISILVYVGANVIHIGQVWCYHDWNWNAVVTDYFAGTPGKTSLSMRVTRDGLAGRWFWTKEIFSAYSKEIFANVHGHWTTPAFWFWIMGCLVNIPRSRSAGWGILAFLLISLGSVFMVPGLWRPDYHLHYLTRYVIMLPIGALIIAAVGQYGHHQRAL